MATTRALPLRLRRFCQESYTAYRRERYAAKATSGSQDRTSLMRGPAPEGLSQTGPRYWLKQAPDPGQNTPAFGRCDRRLAAQLINGAVDNNT